MVLVKGPRPIVVDPGSLTDADQLPQLLNGVRVATVVCSHYHSDHVDAVAALPHRRSATPIPWHYTATHNWD
jgi:glyoxylase-like metal-dependent hydrolase (beta-lactamase superfamily II)